MKQFKHNYTSTYLLQVLCLVLFIPPMVVAICGVAGAHASHPLGELLSVGLPITAIGILALILLCELIHLIISIFTKPQIMIDRDGVSYQNEKVRFDEVEHIRFELGHLRKYTGGEPCTLSLIKNGEAVMSIEYPSFIATCMILKRCPHATKRLFPKALAIGYAVSYPLSVAVYLITVAL